jgi:beta-lactam-binding protein with PASTA domain
VIKFFRLLVRSLMLLVIALLSALLAMRMAIHGREVRVPNLAGLTMLQAQQTANGSGLLVSVEERFYSGDVPAGSVISQMPAPNSKVRRGWRVRVTESLGPQRVTIPNVIGQSERAASINLRQRGLELGTVSSVQLPDPLAGQVIAQEPPANADANSPKVSLLVSEQPDAPEYVMPNLVGRSLAEAREKIARAGLEIESVAAAEPAPSTPQPPIGTVSVVAPGPPPSPTTGIVVTQNPSAGSRISAGTSIRLQVQHRMSLASADR